MDRPHGHDPGGGSTHPQPPEKEVTISKGTPTIGDCHTKKPKFKGISPVGKDNPAAPTERMESEVQHHDAQNENPQVQQQKPHPMNFKEKLFRGKRPIIQHLFGADEVIDNLEEGVILNRVGPIPKAFVHQRVEDKLAAKWKNVIIVKLMGGTITLAQLQYRLERMWTNTKGFVIADMDRDYFSVTFADPEDVQMVLTKGPWLIGESYLFTQRWDNTFNAELHKRGPNWTAGQTRNASRAGINGSRFTALGDLPNDEESTEIPAAYPPLTAENQRRKEFVISTVGVGQRRERPQGRPSRTNAWKELASLDLDRQSSDKQPKEKEPKEKKQQAAQAIMGHKGEQPKPNEITGLAETSCKNKRLNEKENISRVPSEDRSNDENQVSGSGDQNMGRTAALTESFPNAMEIGAGGDELEEMTTEENHTQSGELNPSPIRSHSLGAEMMDKEEVFQMSQSSKGSGMEEEGVLGTIGAASEPLRQAFDDFVSQYKPDVAAVFEPRIGGLDADSFIKRSKFDRSFRVEAVGFTGGIWVMWTEGIQVEVLACHKQFVHTKVYSPVKEFFIIFVYGSPIPGLRRELWGELTVLSRGLNGPWLIGGGGDFNSILFESESKGGTRRSGITSASFADWISENQLWEVRTDGVKFTWRRGRLQRRLDRFLCNDKWCGHMVDANQTRRPFRFLAAWLTHEKFDDMVRTAWNNGLEYGPAVDLFQQNAQQWNREVFGNIFQRKQRAMGRLMGIQRARETSESQFLDQLESELQAELNLILQQEESLLIQKSTRAWNLEGDKNTTFYHNYAKGRKRRNKVVTLQDDGGELVDDQGRLREMVLSFFKTLYSARMEPFIPYPVTNCFPVIEPEKLQRLGMAVGEPEILGALKEMAL
ncbi:OLC1v1024159C1 [Oldenlandia corymbosa var. corymbosa]|uniref:OLC1v1024159C1 n=1 Tax=Oldenlandia corymbosa var. corymbosa TaxID=529605 RepID=A0AAV1C338_OLDCO|nr:OLC1v1024159C1 [Oldenlandia corymbosa var. corymbosa]